LRGEAGGGVPRQAAQQRIADDAAVSGWLAAAASPLAWKRSGLAAM
jgi:hypothetical protein